MVAEPNPAIEASKDQTINEEGYQIEKQEGDEQGDKGIPNGQLIVKT